MILLLPNWVRWCLLPYIFIVGVGYGLVIQLHFTLWILPKELLVGHVNLREGDTYLGTLHNPLKCPGCPAPTGVPTFRWDLNKEKGG